MYIIESIVCVCEKQKHLNYIVAYNINVDCHTDIILKINIQVQDDDYKVHCGRM